MHGKHIIFIYSNDRQKFNLSWLNKTEENNWHRIINDNK